MKHVLVVLITIVSALLICSNPALGGKSLSLVEKRQAAESGDMLAQFELGKAYDFGEDTERDTQQAAIWYQKAAAQGHGAAQNNLGSLYQFGDGVKQDYVEAVRWYQKSVQQGYPPDAYSNLGYMYANGLGVQKDEARAITLYREGVDKGSLRAMANLGVVYWKSDSTTKDLEQAFMWLELTRFYTQKFNDMKLKWQVRGMLDELKKEMSKDQIKRGEKLAKEWSSQWIAKHQ